MLIEILMFRLLPDAEVAAFLEADRRVQTEFIPNRPGFVRRTTACGADDREWVVVTLWGSADDADATAELAAGDEAVAAFEAHVDQSSVERRRYTTLD